MPETADLRTKARRVKNHILTRYLKLADRVDEKGEGDLSETEARRYWELTSEFARNVVPRSQEITGEEGSALQIKLIKYGDQDTLQLDTGTAPIIDTTESRQV